MVVTILEMLSTLFPHFFSDTFILGEQLFAHHKISVGKVSEFKKFRHLGPKCRKQLKVPTLILW